MNTTNTISSTASALDAMTGQALAMVSNEQNSGSMFQSALRDQLHKKSTESAHIEKKLPHSGKELPDKKIKAQQKDKQDSAADAGEAKQGTESESHAMHESVNDQNTEHSAKQEKHTAQNAQTDNGHAQNDHEQANHEQANHEQASSGAAQNDHEQQVTESQQNYDELQTHYLQNISIEENTADTQQASQNVQAQLANGESLIDDTAASESNIQDQVLPGNAVAEEKIADPVVAEQVLAHKNLTSAENNKAVTSTAVMNDVALSDNSKAIDMSTGAGNRNETALTKSIADFQQYIEMSKKHSMAGESIASVKHFEQAINVQQLSAQQALSDAKLSTLNTQMQTMAQSVQAVGQTVSSDKVTAQPSSLLQTASNFEVKTPLAKPGWNNNFANQIVMMAKNGVQKASIKLNPQHLGPVEATVKLSSEGTVVQLNSTQLATREALEAALPRLKEMLNDSGFAQVDVNVSQQDRQQQESALAAGQDPRNGSNHDPNSEHGDNTMPGGEQLSVNDQDSEADMAVSEADAQGLKIVDYYA